jgi:hypothetical protein
MGFTELSAAGDSAGDNDRRTGNVLNLLPNPDQGLVRKLVNLVGRYVAQPGEKLTLCHAIGSCCNGLLGAPTERQAYGKKTVKRLAESLGIDPSTLARMRWFACLFSSLSDLKRRYPDVTTWSAVKGLLSLLKPKGRQVRTKRPVAGLSPKVMEMGALFQEPISLVARSANGLSELERKALRKLVLQDFTSALTPG